MIALLHDIIHCSGLYWNGDIVDTEACQPYLFDESFTFSCRLGEQLCMSKILKYFSHYDYLQNILALENMGWVLVTG